MKAAAKLTKKSSEREHLTVISRIFWKVRTSRQPQLNSFIAIQLRLSQKTKTKMNLV